MPNLFSEFSNKSKAEWLAKVEKDLKGKPLDGLDWSPFEGLTMSPFFHSEDLPEVSEPLVGNREDNTWEIGEQVIVDDVKTANQQALEALKGGATALGFVIQNEISSMELGGLLDSIQHEFISTNFYFEHGVPENFVADFHQIILAKKQSPSKVAGSISPSSRGLGGVLPKFRFFHISGKDFYQSKDLPSGKENPAEELAQILRATNDLIQPLTDDGLSFLEIAGSMQISLAIGTNYFLAIAKIRAFKLMWENLAAAYGDPEVECPPIEVYLGPSSQGDDADTNKISTTTQAMAAIIGGANRLYLLPSDAFENKEGTPFNKRIARNVQHVLQLESYLDRVADPAAGSYFVENLTDELAERAWEVFRAESRE